MYVCMYVCMYMCVCVYVWSVDKTAIVVKREGVILFIRDRTSLRPTIWKITNCDKPSNYRLD